MKQVYYFLALLSLTLISCAPDLPSIEATPPNIVLILSDDHGFEDAGAYGNPVVQTPNIDRLAQEGMRFTRMYTTSAMCTPSRSALYTGLYPHQNGAFQNHSAIQPDVKAMPHYLAPLGYRVGLLGKKHIKPLDQFGFELVEPDNLNAFINSESPYLLIVTPNEPHAPASMTFDTSKRYAVDEIPIPPYLVDTPDTRSQRTGYYDLIDILDQQVGDVIGALETHGTLDQTLLIYASDHGAGFPFEKWTCYEAGLKIPFIARWPGFIEPNSTTDAMTSLIDVLPTFLELAGATSPDSLGGQSFAGVLRGQQETHRDLIFGTHTTTGIIEGSYYPIRSVRDHRFKYIRNLNPTGTFTNLITNRTGQGGWASWIDLAKTDNHAQERTIKYQTRPHEELYDLHTDPYELNNLADSPAHATRMIQLRNALEAWMLSTGDTEQF